MQMTDVVNRRKIRHAHMVNIEKRIMFQGMRADFLEVDALSVRVFDIASKAGLIRATTPAGTDIRGRLNPSYKWLKTSGIISPNKWGNLPGGEIFTAPDEVNGVFVVDGVVGDYLCAKLRRPARDSAHPSRGGATASARLSSAESTSWKTSSGNTPTPTKTATAWASSPSAPTSASAT